MRLELLFHNIISKFTFYGDQVAIAVSGGVDSVVLLHLMINWIKKNKPSLSPIALTVNHGLRSESQKEANFILNYAKELGANESLVLNWEEKNIKGNIQLQARKARYNLITKWCKNNNVKCLFVAHHKDDQAETLLLRLERGSGIDGLSSMDFKYFLNGIYVFRPLLDFSRGEIKKYAKLYKLRWVEDKSNCDLKYRRTLYRNLFKASDNQDLLIDRICLTALHMKRAVKALMYYTRLALNECINIHDLGYIEIKLNEFYKLPEEIALRLLLYSIMAIVNKYYKLRYRSLIEIFNRILQRDSDINCTLSGCKIRKYGESILVMRESSKIQEITVHLRLSVSIEWDNRFKCTLLSNQKCSVTIAPLKKTQKVPKFLKSYNCYPEIFYSLPVVLKDGKIFAYSCMRHDSKSTSNNEIKCFIDSIVAENLLKLISV